MFVLILVISLLALTSATESASISGEITFQDGARPDTVYVGLYDYQWRDDFFGNGGEPQALQKLTNKSSYKFNVEAGLYTVVTWGFGYENAHYKVYIENDKIELEINFDLPRKGLPETISHIALIGDYCGWDANQAAQLTFENNVWRTDAPDSMHIGQKYKFFVWEKGISGFREFLIDPSNKPIYRYSPAGKHMQASINWGTFDHIYQGEKEFVIDPATFDQPIKKAGIIIKGWELANQFNQLFEDLYLMELKTVEPLNRQEGPIVKFENPEDHYYIMRAKWDSLEAAYDPYFADAFVEKKLRLYELFSPIRKRSWVLDDPNASQNEIAAFFQSDSFHYHFADMVSLVKRLDPNSYLYDGHFVYNVLVQVPRYLDKWPPLAEQYDITSEECKAILDNFAQNSKNPLTRETVIYELQSRYAQMDSTALVEQYQKMLYDEFPDGFAVQELDRQKNSFSWQRVAPYPALDFSIKTLDGDDIKLSDYRGRFVLIDFWGSWCGPCRQEIPNIVNMVTMLPNDKLQVIGLAKDEEKDLRKYLDKNSLPYPNALVDDELLKAWNIQYYPSNFLINPHGEVIAKDIRGPKMGLEIGVEIAKWQF